MSESVIFNPAEEFAGYRIKIDIDGERCSYEIVKYGDESFSLCSTKDYPGVYLALAAAVHELALQVGDI